MEKEIVVWFVSSIWVGGEAGGCGSLGGEGEVKPVWCWRIKDMDMLYCSLQMRLFQFSLCEIILKCITK